MSKLALTETGNSPRGLRYADWDRSDFDAQSRWAAAIFVLLWLGLVGLVCVAGRSFAPDLTVVFAFLSTILIALVPCCWICLRSGPERSFCELCDGLESAFDGRPEDVALVRCSIYESEVLTGVDAGVLWVQDDLLAFKGARTCFALGRADCDSHGLWSLKSEFYRHTTEKARYVSLTRPGLTGRRKVTFEWIPDAAGAKVQPAGHPSGIVKSFMRRASDSFGELPPCIPGAGARSPSRYFFEALARPIASAILLGCLASVWTSSQPMSHFHFPVLVGVFAFFYLFKSSKWRLAKKSIEIRRTCSEWLGPLPASAISSVVSEGGSAGREVVQ